MADVRRALTQSKAGNIITSAQLFNCYFIVPFGAIYVDCSVPRNLR